MPAGATGARPCRPEGSRRAQNAHEGTGAPLRWHRLVLACLIAIGLLAGLPALAHRISAERADRRVELVADQTDFVAAAQSVGVDPRTFLARLHADGVQGLGVSEDSLVSLQQQGLLSYMSGAEWLGARIAAGQPAPPLTVQASATYVMVAANDTALANFVAAGLRATTGLPAVTRTISGASVVEVNEPPNVVEQLPLGFRPGAFDLARSVGMDVVPRPLGTDRGYTASDARALFARIASAGVPVHTILFAGASTTPIPGYPAAMSATADAIRGAGWSLGVLETSKQLGNVDQPGTETLSTMLGLRNVRVYSVPTWMLTQYTLTRTVQAIVDSVQDRNLRLVYLHPYTTGADVTGRTLQLYAQAATTLRARGFTLAPPQPFPQLRVHRSQRVAQAVGVVAAGLWLLELLFPEVRRWGYWPLVVLGGLAVLAAAGSATLSVEAVSLGAAGVAGGLSVYFVAGLWGRLAGRSPRSFGGVWALAVGTMVAMAAITFGGALIVGSVLGDTAHLLEWTYFHGVKATYLGIPFLAACAFAATVGFAPEGEETRRGLLPQVRWLGRQPVRYGAVGAFVLALGVLGIYLLRSGNVSASLVPGIEAHMRALLQQHLPVRPREKEFLVGYPSLFLAVLFASRRSRWGFFVFLLGASVSQVSVADTFEHIRTPFLRSVERSGMGLAVGLLTGTAALAVFWLLYRLLDRRRAAGP